MESLVELARTLDDDSVRDVIEHLAHRVEHKSPYVKRKALKVLKALVENGGGRVARHVAKSASALRAAEQHTGAMHPSKGDSINASVREAAREVLAVTFARGAEPTSRVSGVPLGRTLMSASSSGATNRRAHDDDDDDDEYGFRTTPTKPTTREGVLDAPLEASLASTPKLNVGEGATKWKPLRPPSPEKPMASTSDATVKLSLAGMAAPTSVAATLDLLSDFSTAAAAPKTTTTAAPKPSKDRGGAFDLQCSEELRAINALCTPSGVRLAPVDGDVERFLRDGSMNYDARGVVTALAAKLVTHAGDDWKSAFRAACVLEYAWRTRHAHGAWLVDVFVNSSAMELLTSVANDASAQSQLRQKFADTHAVLSGVIEHEARVPSSASVEPIPAAKPIDLLSQLGDLSVAPPTSTSNPLDALFGNLTTTTGTATSCTPTSTSTTHTSTYPQGYHPPAQPMRGPGLAALDAIPPPVVQRRAESVPQFDFIKDLMK